MHCNVEFYYVGKIPRTGIGRPSKQRRVVLRRRNTVVGGKCALPSALLVYQCDNAANNVRDVVAVLVIFFEAKLVHALRHSLGVVRPVTGNCDTAEYFLKSSNGHLPKSVLCAQG